MASRIISFRLDEDEIPLLESHSIEGESHQLAAQRIVREHIGSPGQQQLPADWKSQLMPEIRAMVEEILADRELKPIQLTKNQPQLAKKVDLAELRDRTLASLKLGAQSASYKASRKAIDIFIANLQDG